jgi:uncharacterized membrane protein YgcG
VVAAKNSAATSATRQAAISAGIRNLPGFLEQLRPAMVQLGAVADNQTPALRNLNASAHQLDVLVRQLRPFSNASLPAIQAFGRAAQTGRAAVKAATPTVQQLNTFAQGTPELGQNLAIVLEHLDNRAYAVEQDPRSPGGQGFTGLESLLNFVFYQSTAITLFDQSEHLLNTTNFFPLGTSNCGSVSDAATVKSTPGLMAKCGNYLGPTQPGLSTPDPTAGQAGAVSARERRAAAGQGGLGGANGGGSGNAGGNGGGSNGGGGSGGAAQQLQLPNLGHILPAGNGAGAVTGVTGLPGVNVVPGVGHGSLPLPTGTTGGGGRGGAGAGHLLDYLMGP